MRSQLAIFVALGCCWGCTGIPQLIECANDTATRLRLGGKAIMAGPVKACPAQCPVSISKKAMENGNIQITVTTSTDGIGFAVRVNDGAGKISSKNANISQTTACDRQMYSHGSNGVPAGAYVVELIPAKTFATLNDLVVTVGFAKNFAPGVVLVQDPPLPPPTAYKCVNGQCASSATGVDLPTCQQLCHPSPPSPPPSPPGQLFKCKNSQCAASATGVDLPTCQQLCHPSPPSPPPSPPGQLFKCKNSQCAASATGVDMPTCQKLCKGPPSPPTPTPPSPSPPPPVPPSPSGKYCCVDHQCQPKSSSVTCTGVDLGTCQQLCKAPGPSPPPSPPPPAPPGQLFKCVSQQCTASAGGVDLPTCQQLCKAPGPAPTPPGPSPPGPWPGSCAGTSCPVCITDYVLGILASVERCLTLQIGTCITTSLTCIENLVLLISECTPGDKAVGDLAAIRELSKLLSKFEDAHVQQAAAGLQRALNATSTLGGLVV